MTNKEQWAGDINYGSVPEDYPAKDMTDQREQEIRDEHKDHRIPGCRLCYLLFVIDYERKQKAELLEALKPFTRDAFTMSDVYRASDVVANAKEKA